MFRGRFRGRFCEHKTRIFRRLARRAPEARGTFLARLRATPWVVYAKHTLGHPGQLLDYLSRYVQRVAISNERLLGLAEGVVRFAYRDRARGNRRKTMSLPATQFLQRSLLHVLPTGFTRIRHYGLLANRNKRECLAQARAALNRPTRPLSPSSPSRPSVSACSASTSTAAPSAVSARSIRLARSLCNSSLARVRHERGLGRDDLHIERASPQARPARARPPCVDPNLPLCHSGQRPIPTPLRRCRAHRICLPSSRLPFAASRTRSSIFQIPNPRGLNTAVRFN